MKRFVIFSIFLCISRLGQAGMFDHFIPGVAMLRNQVDQLNFCAGRYMAAIERKAKNVGGDVSGAVNFEIDTAGACRLVVASTSSVTAAGVVTLKTLTSTSNGISPALLDQTVVFSPFVDTNSPPTPYSTSAGPIEIKTWQASYTPGTSSVNLKAIPVFAVDENLLAQVGVPLSLAAG